MSDLVLGVDGGGSKTMAVLMKEGQVLGRGVAGASNVQMEQDVAFKAIDQAIAGAFADAGTSRRKLRSACLALAGAGRPADRVRVETWAGSIEMAERVVVTDDALPVIYAAQPDGVGVALISGTGSMALGRIAGGRTERCGGWGPVFGDEGSGYQLAVSALRAAVRSEDGRAAPTKLLADILTHFGLRKASDLIEDMRRHDRGRSEISQLAPLVVAAAQDGDPTADRLVSEAAEELALMVTVVTRRLEISADYTLAMAGGQLANSTTMRSRVIDKLKRHEVSPKRTVIVSEPAIGAAFIADARRGLETQT